MTAEDIYNLGIETYYAQDNIEGKSQALAHFQKAADMGLDLAMLRLGEMHFFGDGIKTSKGIGLKWLKLAAKTCEHYNDLYVYMPSGDSPVPVQKFINANQ